MPETTLHVKTIQQTENPNETKMMLTLELMRSYQDQFADTLACGNSEAEYERQLKRYFRSLSSILYSK